MTCIAGSTVLLWAEHSWSCCFLALLSSLALLVTPFLSPLLVRVFALTSNVGVLQAQPQPPFFPGSILCSGGVSSHLRVLNVPHRVDSAL